MVGTIHEDGCALAVVEEVGSHPAALDQPLGVAGKLETHPIDHSHPFAFESRLAEVQQASDVVLAR